MEKVANSIKELLSESNRVIVPDFGAFIGKNVSAKIDDAKNMVYPPTKKVSFNDRLKLNDENLANYVAAKSNIEVTKAKSEISEFVNAIKNKLDVDGGVSIEGLGSFEMNGTNVIYKQASNANFDNESFELEPVSLPGKKEVAAEVMAEREALKAGESGSTATMSEAAIERRRRRREQLEEDEDENKTPIWLFVLPFLILLLLGYLIYSLWSRDVPEQEIVKKEPKIFGEPTPRPTIVNPVRKVTPKPVVKKQPKKYRTGKWGSLYTNKTGLFVIMASVQDKAMAEQMASDLRAFDQYETYIEPGPNGYNRIAIYCGNDRAKADKQLERVQKGYSASAWIYTKKK